ncbi:MAG TPA: RNA polymerase sigma factor [Planctomycetota bacterium]|nr:RNA polymerase sigma factor [Planctomycetota bacterium]
MDETEVARLLVAAQRRDHDAFIALMEFYRPRLWARALSCSRDRFSAEDLLQETYLRAYRNIHQARDSRALGNWLLTILQNAGTRQPPAAVPAPELEADEARAGACEALQEASTWGEQRHELQQALTQLPPQDREMLSLRFGAGLRAEDIAAQLQERSGTIRMRLCRALNRLRSLMGVKRASVR